MSIDYVITDVDAQRTTFKRDYVEIPQSIRRPEVPSNVVVPIRHPYNRYVTTELVHVHTVHAGLCYRYAFSKAVMSVLRPVVDAMVLSGVLPPFDDLLVAADYLDETTGMHNVATFLRSVARNRQ